MTNRNPGEATPGLEFTRRGLNMRSKQISAVERWAVVDAAGAALRPRPQAAPENGLALLQWPSLGGHTLPQATFTNTEVRRPAPLPQGEIDSSQVPHGIKTKRSPAGAVPRLASSCWPICPPVSPSSEGSLSLHSSLYEVLPSTLCFWNPN